MDLIKGVNVIVSSLLPKNPTFYSKSKFINDPIWGTIEIRDYEQTIIDTPLFQRLRYIHQTGFTFFTYPTARHSRFEHSLGVSHIANRIFNVLHNKHPSYKLDDRSLTRIRLAALLHDTGHSAFSHTTEEFYGGLVDIKNQITKTKKFNGKGAGEVLSHLIINSQAFKSFFSKIQKRYKAPKRINISDVANLVIGKSEFGYEADIISSPVDADKLDYFPRDGRAAGIDISLDIHRLINCMEIQETKFYGDDKKRKSLVINRRGYNALQQLLFARATLTASVYHHHKVRACDSMIKNVMQEYVDKNVGFKKSIKYPKGIKLNATPNFLLITDNDFRSEINNLKPSRISYKILSDLFNRNLSKRVLKISFQTVTTEKDRGDGDQCEKIKAQLAAFYNLRKNPELKLKLLKAILKEAKISKLTQYELGIDIIKKPNFQKAGDAPINTANFLSKPNIVNLKQVIPISDWIKGYESFFGHSYIFGPPNSDIRIKLAIASAKILSTPSDKNIYKGFCLVPTYDAIAEDIRDKVKAEEKKLGITLFRK